MVFFWVLPHDTDFSDFLQQAETVSWEFQISHYWTSCDKSLTME